MPDTAQARLRIAIRLNSSVRSRGARAANAAAPAVEVRSTCWPRANRRGAVEERQLTVGDSAFRTDNDDKFAGRRRVKSPNRLVACSCSTSAPDVPVSRAATPSVSVGSQTVGIHARRLCFAASRAVRRHFATARSPRAPLQTVTHRAARQGTDLVRAELGRQQLHRELTPVALG